MASMVPWLTFRGLPMDRFEVYSADPRLTFRGLPAEGLGFYPSRLPRAKLFLTVPAGYSDCRHRRASPGQHTGPPIPGPCSRGFQWEFVPSLRSRENGRQRCCSSVLLNASLGRGPPDHLGGPLGCHPLGWGRCQVGAGHSPRPSSVPRSLARVLAAARMSSRSCSHLLGGWYLGGGGMDLNRGQRRHN